MNRIAWSMLLAWLVAVSICGCACPSNCSPGDQSSGCVPAVCNYGDYDPNMHGNYPD